ncbi:hypothetical protein EJB05_24194, partial [Eragrostis curvula]
MEGGAPKESSVLSEVKKQLGLAVPLFVGCFLQKIILNISLIFVGHLGELALGSASLATSFASASGFYLMTGISWSLDTLCGQAFGAEQHRLVGVYKQRAMLVLAMVSIPVAVVWAFAGEILVLFRQDPEIAAGARSYLRWMVPVLFLFGQLQCYVMFLQAQNIVVPLRRHRRRTRGRLLAAGPQVWPEVNGAALAIVVSYFFNTSCLALYVTLAPSCKKTWTGFSREAFRGIPAFLKLAVPSALINFLEGCAFELLMLLSGLLSNPKLETAPSSQNILYCATLNSLHHFRQSGSVSNELGAGRPQAAHLATRVVMLLAFSMSFFVALVLVLSRNRLGYLYTNVDELALYSSRPPLERRIFTGIVQEFHRNQLTVHRKNAGIGKNPAFQRRPKIVPILAPCFFFDSMQGVLSGYDNNTWPQLCTWSAGVVRGCGRQNIGAFINLAAYYLVGIPAASIFAFVSHLRGKGLWLGIFCGVAVQMLLLLFITLCTKWNKEASKANRNFLV